MTTTTTQIAESGDSGLTTLANVLSVFTAAVLVIGLVWGLRQWWRWRKPIRVTFLLPKTKYALRRFQGAPAAETHPKELSMGVGVYDVPIRVQAMTDMEIVQLRVAIHENDLGTRPVDLGRVPSRWQYHTTADHLGRHRYVDWNGEVRLSQDFDSFPRVVPRGDNCLITHRIRTLGDWDGEIAIVMALRGRFTRSRVVSLPLHVSRYKDDVPFLRAVRDVQAVLTMDRAFDTSVVLCLGVKNDRASSIEAELNFRVPNYVSELVPADQDGAGGPRQMARS